MAGAAATGELVAHPVGAADDDDEVTGIVVEDDDDDDTTVDEEVEDGLLDDDDDDGELGRLFCTHVSKLELRALVRSIVKRPYPSCIPNVEVLLDGLAGPSYDLAKPKSVCPVGFNEASVPSGPVHWLQPRQRTVRTQCVVLVRVPLRTVYSAPA